MPGTHTCHTWHKELPTYTHIIYTCTAWGVNFYHQAPIGIMYLYMKVCFRAWTVVLDLHLDSLWGATPCTCAPQVSAAAVQIHELCVGICVCRVYAEHVLELTHTQWPIRVEMRFQQHYLFQLWPRLRAWKQTAFSLRWPLYVAQH